MKATSTHTKPVRPTPIGIIAKTVLIMLVSICLLPNLSKAHTVDHFTNCPYVCAGSPLTITAKISATVSSSKYNWQYKDNSGIWKCFVNGNNSINGSSVSVSGATATGVKTSLSLNIASVPASFNNVEVRLLIADAGSPCASNPNYSIWGKTTIQKVKVLTGGECNNLSDYCGGSGEVCFVSPTKPDKVNARTTWRIEGNKVIIRTTFARSFVDNTYGSNAIGWPGNNHKFNHLVTSDMLQLGLYDVNGNKRLEFQMDYFSSTGVSSSTPSGYGTTGVTSNDGEMLYGSSSNVLKVRTSLSENFNTYGYVLTNNSPSTNSSYAVNPSYPEWIYDVWYEVEVNLSAFPGGFGYPTITGLHASPSKTGNDSEIVKPGPCPGEKLNLGNLVWNDRDGDGKKDPNEPGIGNITVSLYTDNNGDNLRDGAAIRTTVTNVQGYYSFTGLPEGRYIASMPLAPGYSPSPNTTTQETSPNPDTDVDNDNNIVHLRNGILYTNAITLSAGDEPTYDGDGPNGNLTFDLAMCGNSWIGDFVWKDLNGNGKQDPGEPGINGQTVKLTFEDGTVATETTHFYNFDGYYDFKSLGPGTYKVTFETPDGLFPSPANAGGDDTKDSDPVNGSVTVTLAPNESDFTIDAGFTNKVVCPPTQCLTWKFNTNPCAPNRFIWFNSTIKVSGKSSSPTTLFIQNGVITFRANNTNYTVPVPKAQITFSNSVTTPATWFNTSSQTWEIEVPYNTSGDVFAGGVRFPIPASGLPANINPVTWCADFSASSPNLNVKWEWGAAVYSAFSSNYNSLVVSTVDGSNQAGTPVAYKSKLLPGGTGTGGYYYCGYKAPYKQFEPCSNPTVSLGNFVWNDYDGDGKKDPNEYGIPGITVRLYRDNGNGNENLPTTPIATTVTNAQGFYQFTGLEEGKYRASITILPGYSRSPNSTTTTGETPDNNVDHDNNARFPVNATEGQEIYTGVITLTAGEEPTDDGDGANGNNTLDLAICGNLWIGDFVWNDTNGNGIQDAGEQGINGVKVTILFPDGITTGEETTYNYQGKDGYYDFPNLGPGTFKLTFETPAGFRPSPSNQGPNDALDSDPVNGMVTVTLGLASNMTIDAGFTNKKLDCPGSEDANGYWGGFEAGANNFTTTTGRTDYSLGLPGGGKYQVVSNVGQLGGTGYYNVSPLSGNYFFAAQTNTDVYDRIWYTKATVTPGETLNFCAAVRLLKNPGSYSKYLALYAGNTKIGYGKVTGSWANLCGSYTVPAGVTSVEFSIRDINKGCFFVAIDDICIKPGGQLSLGNYVWNDYDGDGQKDPNEYGLAGMKVNLYQDDNNDNIPDDEEPIATTTTNQQGYYKFSNLSEGRYITSIFLIEGFQQSPGWSSNPDNNVDNDNNIIFKDAEVGDELFTNSIELTVGSEPTDDGDGANGNNTLDMAICGNLWIGNFVWYDKDGDGIQEAGENGINGATVKIIFLDGTIATTTTKTYNDAGHPSVDADGYYEFRNLGPGTYLLYFETPDGYVPTLANRGSNTLDSDPIIFGLVPVTLTTESNHDIDAGFTIKHYGCQNNCSHDDCGHSYCGHNSCNNNCNHYGCGHTNCSSNHSNCHYNCNHYGCGHSKCDKHTSCNNNCNHNDCGHSNCGSQYSRTTTPDNPTGGATTTATTTTANQPSFGSGCKLKVNLEATNPLCYGHRTGSVSTTVTGSVGSLSYTWSNGATGNILKNVTSGTYTVTVTDNANGCKIISKPVTLIDPAKVEVVLTSRSSSGFDIACQGSNEGKINVHVRGGVGEYTYEWSNGATTKDLSTVSAGNYTVVVKDGATCPAKATISLKEPARKMVVIPQVKQITCDNTTGAIDLKVEGGVAPYSYSWNTSATSSSVDGLQSGEYSVTVRDALGCEVTETVELKPYDLDVKLIAEKNTLYAGEQKSTMLSVEASGGKEGYTYKWSAADGLADVSNGKAVVSPSSTTEYAVTVTDGLGCSATASVSVRVVDMAASSKEPRVIVSSGRIRVTPNPSTGIFNVVLEGFDPGKAEIRILDGNGKQVLDKQLEVVSQQQVVPFNLVRHARGLYFIQVIAGEKSYKEKIVIK